MKILLVEDDLELGRALQAVLLDDGFDAVWVRMAADARRLLVPGGFAAAVLDLGLPDGDGMSLLQELRGSGDQLPVVLITARDALEDRLSGFATGADDYLVKPFDVAELLARLRAVLRRTHGASAGTRLWTSGALALDERRKATTCDGEPVALSPTEYSLLLALMQAPDRVVTRTELEDRALAGNDSQSLDVHMSNLRKKIGEQRVRTVRGVGYMIAP
ncbi:two-component system, OmpR family, response regulator QseB/two-component system, OmpR family, response regulator BasR [Duganella sp. CF458]|uniref:response regulator n=1 Tax=Duganella sp. CF458 TaxID=1884368 RepID=UPI0008EDD9F9|nr:response regulator transcription factor [Duganella sp. CF458]SFG60593.1 two-component system, OmpR family, response regulator QseB/two-component system, OmpR family, response regulator BasR [Duganella sp. CF458]